MSKARVLSVLSSNLAADASLPSTSLATVNSNVGSFGSATAVPIVIVNAKGLVTAVSTASITVPTLSSQLTNDSGFATETYVGTAISNLVASSPTTLDTLNELAAALGDDANFATTTATAIGLKAPLTGAGVSGTWNIGITGNAATVTDITSSQVTTALGFTPYNVTNPNGYTTNVGTVTAVTSTGPIASTGGTTPVISMPAATTTVDGHLTAADWTIFNNKQVAGTYATGTGSASGTNTGDNAVNSLYSGLVTNATHTGDATGSTALTLATVNANVGTFGSTTAIPVVTVNGKGLVTAISTTSITVPTAVSQLSNDSSFATTTYVGTAIANLVASSPAALDTLNELAAALGNDASFATTTATNLGLKAVKTTTISAGTGLTGGGDLGANRTLALAASGVTAGTYNNVTVDTYGRATSGSNVAYLTGYTEVDTLASVTARGATTTTSVTAAAYYNTGGALGSSSSNAKNHFTGTNSGSAGAALGWISAAFGDTNGYRTVIGQASGYAYLGAHSAALDNWAPLQLQNDSANAVVMIGYAWNTAPDTAYRLKVNGAFAASNFSGTSSGTNTGDNPGVTSVAGVTPIISSGGTTPSISHATSGATAGTYNNVTVDTFGHVTSGSNTAYLTGYTESDTLATVTARGATTSTASTFSGGITGAINGMPNDGNGLSGMGISTTWDARPQGIYDRYSLNWHTGISLSGYPGYGGVRLYASGYPSITTSTLRLEASDAVYTYGGLYNNGNAVLHAGNYNSYSLPLSGGTLTGKLRINGDLWGPGSDYAALVIRGTYPSMIYRSTTHNSVWLLHHDSNFNWYGANDGNADSTAWTKRMHLQQDGVLYINNNIALHAANYNSYSPTLTGGGASGTWGINVTGTSNNITAYTINQNLGTANGPTFGEVYSNGWLRNNNNNTGLYNSANANHFYSNAGTQWAITGNGGASVALQFRLNHETTVKGFVYGDTNGFGLLGSGGNWRVRIVDNDWVDIEGSSVRAAIFYDRDNTAYYVDPNGSSNLATLNVNSLNVADGNLQLYKSQTVDMSNTSTYSVSNYYPVLISVPTSGTWIEVQNNLNSNAPSWSTHPGGFTLNLRWYTNGSGWGTTEVKRHVEQYHERFTNSTICGGITQLGHSNQEVVWLRGGGSYFFKFSRNLGASPQSSDYTIYGESALVRTTVFNAVWDSATGTHNSYNTSVYADSLMSSPIFYDRNDTSYYVDPNSGSTLSSLTVVNTITGSISGTAASETLATVTGRGASTSAAISLSGTLSFAQPVGLSFANGQYIKDNGGGGLAIYSGAAINLTGATSVTGALTVSTTATAATLIGTSAVQVGSATAKSYGVLQVTGTTNANRIDSTNINIYGGTANALYDAALYISQESSNDWAMLIEKNSWEYGITYNLATSHTYGIRGQKGGNEYWRVGTDLLYHNSNIRAPIFYDSNDTSYYCDPASTSNLSIVNALSSLYTPYLYLSSIGDTNHGFKKSSDTFNGKSNGQQIRFYEYQNFFATSTSVSVLHLDANGNVGIGNTAPTYKLDFAVSQSTTDAHQIRFNVNNGASGTGGGGVGSATGGNSTPGGGIVFAPNYTGYTKRSAGMLQVGEGNYFRSGLAFYVNNVTDSTTDWSEALRISSNSNVGIGTQSPTQRIHVVGANSGTGGYTGIFENATNGTNNGGGYLFQNNHSNHSWGAVAEFRTLTGSGGADRPSVIFSSDKEQISWSAGFVSGSSDAFRIVKNHGHRAYAGSWANNNTGWGTEYLTISTSGVVNVPVDIRSPIFYDSNDTTYYVDPNSRSNINKLTLANSNEFLVLGNADVSTTNQVGISWAGTTNPNYSIFKPAGAWIQPLHIAFHTGLKIGAQSAYSGTRFYNTELMATEIFSVGNGDNHVRVAEIGYAGNSFRAPIFYDSDDTSYYLNPNSSSRLSSLTTVGNITSPRFIGNAAWGSANLSDLSSAPFEGGYFGVGTTAKYVPLTHQYTGYDSGYQTHVSTGTYKDANGWGGGWYMAIGGSDSYPTEAFQLRHGGAIRHTNGYVTIEGDTRSPLFYDSNDTGYYLDAAGTSVFNRISTVRTNNFLYMDNNYGHSIVGAYSASRYQGVFAMGDAYKLPADGTTTGSLYGLAWSHPNAGGVAANLNTHGLLVMENGTFLAAVSGSIRARDDMRAPIFYDSNDTAYYVDPTAVGPSAKLASSIYLGNQSTDAVLWDYASGNDYRPGIQIRGSYPHIDLVSTTANGQHGSTLRFAGYDSGSSGTFKHWVIGTASNALTFLDIGFASNSSNPHEGISGYNGTTLIRATTSGYVGIGGDWGTYGANGNPAYPLHVVGTGYSSSDFRAPIFYDSDNTAYYVDPNATSRIRKTNLVASGSGWDDGLNLYSADETNRWNFLVDNGASDSLRIAYNNSEALTINTSRHVTAAVDIRSPIFYDSNDTSYYVDPNSDSRLNGMLVVAGSHGDSNLRVMLNAGDNGAATGAVALQMWCSEPGVTWDWGGFGYNVANDNGTNGFGRINTGLGQAYMRMGTGGQWYFYTANTSGTRTTNMYLAPDNGVEVYGKLYSNSRVDAPIFYDSDNTAYYLDPNTTGTSLNVAGSITAAGNITASSDIRLKEDIEVITDAIDKVKQITGVTYTRKENGKRQTGVIAQDVLKVLPEAVEGSDDSMYSVAYGNMVGLLIESIKEQQKTIESLTARIAVLEAK